MKSTKRLPPSPPEDLTPETRIRDLLAFSLCEAEIKDTDPLSKFTSLDVVEAVVSCERALSISEIDDEALMKCSTVGSLVTLICTHAPVAEVVDAASA